MHIRRQTPCNALMQMVSTQTVNGDTDSSRLQSEAYFQYSKAQTVVSFTETDNDGKLQTTVVTAMENGVVTISRRGICNTDFIVQIGQTHPALYETPLGTLELALYGLEVQQELSETGGRLFIRYSIDINGISASENTVTLQVKLKQSARRIQKGDL